MRPPRLPRSRLFNTPPLSVVLATLAVLGLSLFAVGVSATIDRQDRLSIEQAVYRALLDSCYTVPNDAGSPPLKEILVYDHFVTLGVPGLESEIASSVTEWLRDSVPHLPSSAIEDFRRNATDTSALRVAFTSAAVTAHSSVWRFSRLRAGVRLIDDSTLARFFSREIKSATGWTGFRAAYPNGTGIVSLSRIGLSPRREWAIVYAGQQSDWLAGGGYVYVLQRRAARWRIVSSLALWVS
jgi:hypothetical protein